MSLRLAASLMTFSTFFSSLCTSAKTKRKGARTIHTQNYQKKNRENRNSATGKVKGLAPSPHDRKNRSANRVTALAISEANQSIKQHPTTNP
jgi:hypothetical protein